VIKQLPFLFISAMLLTACGGSSSSDGSTSNSTSDNTANDENNDQSASATPDISNQGFLPFVCSANVTTESTFSDTFVASNGSDTTWSTTVASDPTNVSQIADAFNTARDLDPTIKQKLLMPSQADWDAMTSSEKGLYLVNSERCARGVEPFEGISPELITSTSGYANELSDSGAFSHNHGLYANPTERLSGYADVAVGTNADWMAQTENLSRHVSGSSAEYPTVYEPVARAIYTYMYDDSDSNYGHRTLTLIKIANDNSGEVGSEGLFALSKTTKRFEDSPYFKTDVTSVMHVFDPNDQWDMSNVATAPTIYGPETAEDCLSGTFIESTDVDGNNTSTCQ
jgi:hypothetical protein